MPPSWIRSLQDHVATVGSANKVPEMLHYTDWSRSLANAQLSSTGTFNEGILARLALPGEVCVMAFEPVQGYLAVGTTLGSVHIFGSAAVQLAFTLRPAQKVKFLAFKSGSGLLVCIDEKDNISVYDLERPDPQIRAAQNSSTNQYRATSASTGQSHTGPPHPDTPMRVAAYTARNKVMCVELSPSHSHMFLGLRDGTIDTYDLERFSPSPYRVPNLWWEEEEILRKSGVPDAPSRRHVPLIIDIKSHPKDINQLLLAYEGGAILLDVKERAVLKTYQLRLLPGAPGPGGDPQLVWTERASPATCISWRPDGEVFAMGHEDGCISFWHVKEDEKPITVRTLEQLDVDRPSHSIESLEIPRPLREPIFKLAWSGFPERSWMEMASESAATWQTGNQQQDHQQRSSNDYSSTGKDEQAAKSTKGTIVTVLGGAVAGRDPPGLYCIHLPPYAAPISLWSTGGPEAQQKLRNGLRQSLQSTAESIYRTPSLVEDFLLLPKVNPHYSGNYDPMAVLTLLGADPSLPTLPPPAAARGLSCYAFPPRVRMPSPGLEPQSQQVSSAPPRPSELLQKQLAIPLPLTLAGSGAVLGAKFETLSPHAYRKLVGLDDVTGLNQKQQNESELSSMRSSRDDSIGTLDLLGGKASSSLVGEGGQSLDDLARSSKFRILITWHLDGSIRFHDASPHLLLLGEMDEADAAADPNVAPRIWLKRSFPSALPHLTISTRELLRSEAMWGHPTFDRIRNQARIQGVEFAPEVLEVGISLSTGQLLHYRFDFARLSETKAVQEDVEQSIREEEANLQIPAVTSPRSPPASFHASITDTTSSALDDEMARAMRELDANQSSQPEVPPSFPPHHAGFNASHGPTSHSDLARSGSEHSIPPGPGTPPPRPRRDPKRLSLMQQSGRVQESAPVTSPRSFNMPQQASHHLTPPPSQMQMPSSQGQNAEELTLLHHMADWQFDGFKPNLMFNPMRGEITAFTISDIGFLAVACGTVLAVLDLRSPELILREGLENSDLSRLSREEARETRKVIEAESKSYISTLTFTVSRVAEDPSLAPRLVVSRQNGFTTIWTLQKTMDMWLVERTSGEKLDEMAGLKKLDILDVAGNVCPALPNELQRALREQQYGPPAGLSDGSLPDANLALGFTDRGISLRFGITGPIVNKAELEERVLGAGVIDRLTDKVAAVVTESSIRIFSLPTLEQITRLQRHYRETGESHGGLASVSLDGHGDFIEVFSSLDVRIWTVFGSLRRPGQPCLTLYPKPAARTMPVHPGAVGSAAGVATSIAGWFGTKTTGMLSIGAQLDAALAGPNRPEGPKLDDPLPPRDMRVRDTREIVENPNAASAAPRRTAGGEGSVRREGSKARDVAGTTDQARATGLQNVDLLKARGAMMSGIEDGLNSLEKGASNFVRNARESAIKSAAKQRFNSLFG